MKVLLSPNSGVNPFAADGGEEIIENAGGKPAWERKVAGLRKSILPVFLLVFFTISSRASDRPNILLILADDLSWADLGCYGHPLHETPNLDRLASGGVRFTQAYSSAPICSASRAALLTGKTTARLGFEFVVKPEAGSQTIPNVPLKTPPFTLDLPLEEITIAEQLGAAGYETAFFGK